MNTSIISLWKVANISYPSAKTYFITGLSPFVITGYEKGIMFICQEKQILSVCRLILAPPHTSTSPLVKVATGAGVKDVGVPLPPPCRAAYLSLGALPRDFAGRPMLDPGLGQPLWVKLSGHSAISCVESYIMCFCWLSCSPLPPASSSLLFGPLPPFSLCSGLLGASHLTLQAFPHRLPKETFLIPNWAIARPPCLLPPKE